MNNAHRVGLIVLLTVLVAGSPVNHQAPAFDEAHARLERYSKYRPDARVEAVARAICRIRGIDPDRVGPPYPQGPLWKYFIPEAAKFVAMYDAAKQ